MFESIYATLESIGYAHPIHPIVAPIPFGVVVAAFLFTIVAWIFKRPAMAQTAYHCAVLALLATPVAVGAGLMDWQHFYRGQWITPIVVKMILAVFLIAALLTVTLRGMSKDTPIKRLLPLYVVCFLLALALGFFGGELVYGNHGRGDAAPEPAPALSSADPLVQQGAKSVARMRATR